MTSRTRSVAMGALAALAVGLAAFLVVIQSPAQQAEAQANHPYKLFAPGASRDGTTQAPPPPGGGGSVPSPDPAYCPGTSGTNAPPSPPNSVIGLLTIGGQQAPVGTLVQIVFDGKVGPGIRTVAAGGYRVDYAAGTAGCANQVGASITILVNGQAFASGVKVGDAAANPFFRFDIAAP